MIVSPWLRWHTAVHTSISQALQHVKATTTGPVYLCGGINGMSDADCMGWRTLAKAYLCGREVIDPMRRDYRGMEDAHAQEITDGDKADIRRSGVVLVNATKPSWGTAMEVMYAYMIGVPCVAFMELK